MYFIVFKFLSREPKKTMNFVRDIAILVVLLLSVGAIIFSVNNQLTNLINLGGQNDILIVRNTHSPIQNSIVPSTLVANISLGNIEKIVPVLYQSIHVVIKGPNSTVNTQISFVAVNVSELNTIIPFQTINNVQIFNFSNNDSIIGSQIVNELHIDNQNLNQYNIFFPSSNKTFYISSMVSNPDQFVNNILIDMKSLQLINVTYNYNYYSELFLKIKDKSKIVLTAKQIQNFIDKYFPNSGCTVLQGTGTRSLLDKVLSTIMKQLTIFNYILDFLIVIRIVQSLLWIAEEFQYELNELKILGGSKRQIYVFFILVSLVISNLGFVLGVMGSIVIPSLITYLLAIVTRSYALILPPTFDQIATFFIQLNLITVVVSITPALVLSNKKILKQKERE